MALNWYSMLRSSLPRCPIFRRELSSFSSPDKTLAHGPWKKNLFIYYSEPNTVWQSSFIRHVSVDNLIQPPPSKVPSISHDDAEVAMLRTRQSWIRRFTDESETEEDDESETEEDRMPGLFVNVPTDELERAEDIGWRGQGYSVFLTHKEITPPPPTETFKMLQNPTWPPDELPYHDMKLISVGHKLYFLGGHMKEKEGVPWKYGLSRQKKPYELSKEVHCYDLLKEGGGHVRCADMLDSGCLSSSYVDTVVHIDGKIYFLRYSGKITCDDDVEQFKKDEDIPCSFHFQEYDIAKNEWTLLPLFDGVENIDYLYNGYYSDHVVIGKKFCVSFGKSSFTFDTVNRVWEDCKLFENNKRMHEEESGAIGGPPFGKLILWDGDILLGIEYGDGSCLPVVAFQLVNGTAVKKKSLTFIDSSACWSKHLVDLGGGYFCVFSDVRNYMYEDLVRDYSHYDCDGYVQRHKYLALVTFKISRPKKQPNNDDDEFVTCEVVEPEALLFRQSISSDSVRHAFCV